MRRLAPIALLTLALTACGGTSDEPTTTPTSASTSSAPSASATTAGFAQSETCRTEMAPLVEVMVAQVDSEFDAEAVTTRIDRLKSEIGSALTACSAQVTRPAEQLMKNWNEARSRLATCNTRNPRCNGDDIGQALFDGGEYVDDIQRALEQPS